MRTLFLTGDISGGEWASIEFGRTPMEDDAYFYSISPLSLAEHMHTPLLIQHSERDLRTKKRPVRLLRVPEETHELMRSGTPFRRAENLAVVRDWFRHYLVDGKRGLPPLPKIHGGR